MGSSAKKKKEKAKDFQKAKLKVGKTRPKNTNATSTSFTAKSIVLKQQSLDESNRETVALFNHNLSLLSSKTESQRRDALQFLTSAVGGRELPQPGSTVVAKAQPLILDGSKAVREQLLKLLRALPANDLGSLEQLVLYIRAGISHLSSDIRLSTLDLLDWILSVNAEGVLRCPGGWVKTLKTFQGLLAWQDSSQPPRTAAGGSWTSTKSSSSTSNSKLVVHQLTSLAGFLTAGMKRAPYDPTIVARQNAADFPVRNCDLHSHSSQSNPFGYLNLFGATRDADGEVYEDATERIDVFTETGLRDVFTAGIQEAKKEGGETGRAAAAVAKALRLADTG